SFDGTVRIWDIDSLKEQATFLGDEAMVQRVAVSRDGQTLASSGNGEVRVWDLGTRKEKRLKGPQNSVYAMRFNADGRSLAAGSGVQVRDGNVSRIDGRLYVWNLAGNNPPTVFNGKRGVPSALDFSDKTLAVAENGELSVYDVATGQPSAT